MMTNNKPKHRCPGPGCDRMVRQSHLACVGHWWTIPPDLRGQLWAAYRSRDQERHRQAMVDCINFLQATVKPAPLRRLRPRDV